MASPDRIRSWDMKGQVVMPGNLWPELAVKSDVRNSQPFEEARRLIERLHDLPERVLDQLLAATTRFKVVTLADTIAVELALPRAVTAERHGQRVGERRRRVAVTNCSERLELRRP